MTTLHSPVGSGRRRLAPPAPEESVPQPQPLPQPRSTPQPPPRSTGTSPMASPVDPPIYSALLRHWQSSGRTVPGIRDQGWNRAVALPVWSDRPPRRV
ncbi:hypothetical protein [Streptomyces sp. cmx-18-6]|uniref:hypothetical protein n=1 Tax=Streptomyces sp. cmx-18-6 TaxID=2790930 RepID=UPI00397F6FC5